MQPVCQFFCVPVFAHGRVYSELAILYAACVFTHAVFLYLRYNIVC